jgi:hypothetical protein
VLAAIGASTTKQSTTGTSLVRSPSSGHEVVGQPHRIYTGLFAGRERQ